MAKPYDHNEAFNLMQYESKDGRERMVIWNSRDGVTPFGCSHPETGTELLHVRWNEDIRAVDHKPEVGEWIWVDLDPEKALQQTMARVEEWWDHPEYPMRDAFESKDAAARVLMKDMFESQHPQTGEPIKLRPPDLVQVTPFLRDALLAERS